MHDGPGCQAQRTIEIASGPVAGETPGRADRRRADYRSMPGNMPFMPRIIFCMPPFENCFMTFCVCPN